MLVNLTSVRLTYVEGHERSDVVEYRIKYLWKMAAIGFLNQANATTEEAASYLPKDLEPFTQECIEKKVVLFHDESTFQANDDDNCMWGKRDSMY